MTPEQDLFFLLREKVSFLSSIVLQKLREPKNVVALTKDEINPDSVSNLWPCTNYRPYVAVYYSWSHFVRGKEVTSDQGRLHILGTITGRKLPKTSIITLHKGIFVDKLESN